mmetsp:Transcript_28391/g.79859  ORF Transcript_28391/g.79859 Transcript_28391/m.79859 type:complete len:91 (-) Transcript_28391:1081-1353(-)
MMSTVYGRIYSSTSHRLTSSITKGSNVPPQALWAFPGFVGFTWFIWEALTDDIKQSVGLWWDPDAIVNRVEAEKQERLAAREAAKLAAKA